MRNERGTAWGRPAAAALFLAAVLAGSANALPDGPRLDDRPRRSFTVIDLEVGPLRLRVGTIRF